MHLKSAFFSKLVGIDWRWTKKALEGTNLKASKQLMDFDEIAFSIEQSDSNNKSCLQCKLDHLIERIKKVNGLPHSNFETPRAADLSQWLKDHPEDKEYLKNKYEEYLYYVSVFTEMKVYSQLSLEKFYNIFFIPEIQGKKTPDLKARHNILGEVFIEAKSINPPQKEEYRLMARIAEFVEVNKDYKINISKKIKKAVEDADEKFSSIGAAQNSDNRIVFLNFIFGADAILQTEEGNRSGKKIFGEDFFNHLGSKYKTRISEINTFKFSNEYSSFPH